MVLVDKLDEIGKPAWIALIVLGFMAWWPVGLLALAFFLGSGRMGCSYRHGGNWQAHWQSKMERMQGKMDRMRSKMEGRDWWGTPPSSGNRAFDEYRSETLRRLEDEQREFKEFLERLRSDNLPGRPSRRRAALAFSRNKGWRFCLNRALSISAFRKRRTTGVAP
jgi:hypothetical protein